MPISSTSALEPGLKAFMTEAEQRSFSKAADLLGVSPSALSQTVRALEEQLGIRVRTRTTRRISLTEAGQRLVGRTRPAVSESEGALQDAKFARERPSGVVRIKCPKLAFQTYIENRIPAFHAEHLDIVLDTTIDDTINGASYNERSWWDNHRANSARRRGKYRWHLRGMGICDRFPDPRANCPTRQDARRLLLRRAHHPQRPTARAV
jgi:DNA-binding MarR family transcriptional regulator